MPVDRWAKPDDQEWDKRFKKAMMYAKQPSIKLSKQERYDLAKMVPTVDSNGKGSWRDLTIPQLDILLSMLEGFIFITYLHSERLDQ